MGDPWVSVVTGSHITMMKRSKALSMIGSFAELGFWSCPPVEDKYEWPSRDYPNFYKTRVEQEWPKLKERIQTYG